MARLLVIQHVPHERLGTFEPVFKEAGCQLVILNTYHPKAAWPSRVQEMDGLVVMGGPQGVYEPRKHPFLVEELALLKEALAARRPVLGVCLGAQLLAEAIGGPGTVRKAEQQEVGWYSVMREPGAEGDPLFEMFGQTETVFQWHGDTFALPKGAVRLASSPLCQEQGFHWRDNVYALQFHVEVTEAIIRAWMQTPVNKAELARLRGLVPPPVASRQEAGSAPDGAGPTGRRQVVGIVDPTAIRRQSPQHAGRLQELGRHVARAFCQLVEDQRPETRDRRLTAKKSQVSGLWSQV